MTQPTTQSDLASCKESIEKFKLMVAQAEQDYQFALAAGNFTDVAFAKKQLSNYRKEIGSLVKTKLALQK